MTSLVDNLLSPQRAAPPSSAESTHGAAVGLASELFFKPLLAELREAQKELPFGGGGRGEEVFGERLDEQLADRIAASDPGGIVRKLGKLLKRHDEASGEGAATMDAVADGPQANWKQTIAAVRSLAAGALSGSRP